MNRVICLHVDFSTQVLKTTKPQRFRPQNGFVIFGEQVRSKAQAFIVHGIHGHPGRKESFHSIKVPVRCFKVQLRPSCVESIATSAPSNPNISDF